jgi:ribosomal protein L15
MQIHELTLAPRKEVKRIGRGGKRGTTSGRGTKGQGTHGKRKIRSLKVDDRLIDRMKKSREQVSACEESHPDIHPD